MLLEKSVTPSAVRLSWWTFALMALIYVAWIGAWILLEALIQVLPWLANDPGQFLYWTLMKLLLWILPALMLIQRSGQRLRDVLGFQRWRLALLWGGGTGLVLAAISLLLKATTHQPLVALEWSSSLINVAIIAPIFEELLFRGAIFGGLLPRHRFFLANTLTTLLF